MLSWVPFCIVLVVCSARRTHSSPLYTDTSSDPQTDMIQRLEVEGAESTDMGEHGIVKDIRPYLLQLDSSRDTWTKGGKGSLQEEKINNMVDYIKAAVLKMAAADSLISQGFLRSDQGSPKTNKRACFWKYCVTN